MRNFAYYLTMAMATAGALPAHAQIGVGANSNSNVGVQTGGSTAGVLSGTLGTANALGGSLQTQQGVRGNGNTDVYIDGGMNDNVSRRGIGVGVNTTLNTGIDSMNTDENATINNDINTGVVRPPASVKQNLDIGDEVDARLKNTTRAKEAIKSYDRTSRLGVTGDVDATLNGNAAADGDRRLSQ